MIDQLARKVRQRRKRVVKRAASIPAATPISRLRPIYESLIKLECVVPGRVTFTIDHSAARSRKSHEKNVEICREISWTFWTRAVLHFADCLAKELSV